MSEMLFHEASGHRARWLSTGDEAYAAMVAAIDAAVRSVRLESYIIRAAGPGLQLREALLRARQRGLVVRVLRDAFGSEELPADFFAELMAAGGEVRVFSPARALRLAFRDHRKLLVCDEAVAVVGGLNIAPEYAGDGITHGWRDLGLLIQGPIGRTLAHSFDAMFTLAPVTPRAVRNFRRLTRRWPREQGAISVLLAGPGWPAGWLLKRLLRDVVVAREVRAMAAYFLPSRRLRRALRWCHRHGGRVQLLLSGPTDVPVARYAGEYFYERLLKAGMRLFEYQPQILHAKLVVIDDIAYVGSCNLDRRSLQINYELLLRLQWPELAAGGRALFDAALQHSHELQLEDWRRTRRWWQGWRAAVGYWVLARLDPYLARRRLRSVR
ncbi:MAG TPA: phosphatidylserine/phosphatidylglycerophosphate/cardiolipin synthase family protein [Steroidobacteraceae bacterium]|nr:phosphatidylserine/phosphatidylglycerophosphate/cardiolipin synthase family protein [Steroidobacteraceae bacterium]